MSNRVEPIRDKKKISAIKNLLKGAGKFRDYCLFVCGINFGLRIGDLLKLKVKDVRNSSGMIKGNFEIIEEKTDKLNMVEINQGARKALQFLFNKTGIDNDLNNFLFYNTREVPGAKPISRIQAYRLVNQWCESVGLTNLNIGTHTLRKTFGYHAWKNGVSIEVLQRKFKHSSTSTTRQYLGIEEADVKDSYHKVNL
ncbi:MAG: tyrosine-type recombinase/integrase [Halanaerobium sp.]